NGRRLASVAAPGHERPPQAGGISGFHPHRRTAHPKASRQNQDVDTSQLALPAGIPQNFEEHVRIMIDLQVLALQSDMTRVSTFMLGRELSNRSYAEIGVP